ncbi:hypothetical protein ABPG74_002609 [Tetrahymena malaccensis]
MDSVSQNQKVQEGLLSHIKNRITIRSMYQDRGIITLDKPQNITLDDEKSKKMNDLQIQIKQLIETIFLLKKQKSDLEGNKIQSELKNNNQKSYQVFQNQGDKNNQVQANLNAQQVFQQNPNSNPFSNNNFYALANQKNSNNQVQGSIQQENDISDIGISAIAEGISNCLMIKTLFLGLSDNNISNDGYRILDKCIANLPKLTTFKAFIMNQYEDYLKSKEIINCNNIKIMVLHLEDQNLNQETFFQFSSQLALCTQARHLLLFLKSFENLGDQGAIEFGKALSQLQKLTYLKLIFYRINIGSQGFQSISAGLSNCTQLEYLSINFSKNNIGDKGISAIAQGMSNCIRVKTLCLSSQENRISEDGYHILNQSIANLPKLTTFKAFIKDQHEDYLKSKEIINCNNIKIVALHLQFSLQKRDIIVHIRKALKMLRLVKLIVYK